MIKSRVAAYCRVAHDDGLALKLQEQSMRQLAEARGYEVIEVVSEIENAASMDRYGIRRLHELADAGAVDVVFARGISRYARGMPELASFAQAMAKKNVEVLAADVGSVTAALRDCESMLNG